MVLSSIGVESSVGDIPTERTQQETGLSISGSLVRREPRKTVHPSALLLPTAPTGKAQDSLCKEGETTSESKASGSPGGESDRGTHGAPYCFPFPLLVQYELEN